MPWLYDSLKPQHKAWVIKWQSQIQSNLQELETITVGEHCFIAPEAVLLAEPGRTIALGANNRIAAHVFIHGPIHTGEHVSLNVGVHMDGGNQGIHIGSHTRIGAHAHLFAFDHQFAPHELVRKQGVRSVGIFIGEDVWIGAQAGITDGCKLGDHCIIGMGAVVTSDIPDWAIAAGIPARIIGDRRDPKFKTQVLAMNQTLQKKP